MNLRCDSMWNTGKENQKRESYQQIFNFPGKKSKHKFLNYILLWIKFRLSQKDRLVFHFVYNNELMNEWITIDHLTISGEETIVERLFRCSLDKWKLKKNLKILTILVKIFERSKGIK